MAYPFGRMGISQIPDKNQGLRLERYRGHKFRWLFPVKLILPKHAYPQLQPTFSGSHATALTGFLFKLFNVKLSFLALTSQTVTKPALVPVTRICATFGFQSKHSISSARAAVCPRRNGLAVLFRSVMKSCQIVHQ
jgi:hypothetical protein